jgi:predicted esterase
VTWTHFSHVLRRRRIARSAPEALVVLLHDLGASGAIVAPVAARWAATVPTTAFIALDGLEHLDAPCDGLSAPAMLNLDTAVDPTVLDRAAQHLEALLGHQLRSHRLDASRLVLVGFGYGGTLALHLFLRQGWSCAGILAFAGQLASPLPRILRIDCKVRLIDCLADARTDHGSLRDKVTLLNARGIDTRGVLLSGSPFSDEAVRHGAAYLVELVATAQRSGPFHVVRERSHA